MASQLVLEKGANVAIDKGSSQILVGLGWKPRQTAGAKYDLDAWAMLLGGNGKVRSDDDIVFYGNAALKQADGKFISKDGSVIHDGDNLTGEGDGDDEVIHIDLAKVPADIDKVLILASIYKGKANGQVFGDIDDAYIRVVDERTGQEYKFLLGEDAATCHTAIMGQLYRDPADPTGWKYRVVGKGFEDELVDVAQAHGVVF